MCEPVQKPFCFSQQKERLLHLQTFERQSWKCVFYFILIWRSSYCWLGVLQLALRELDISGAFLALSLLNSELHKIRRTHNPLQHTTHISSHVCRTGPISRSINWLINWRWHTCMLAAVIFRRAKRCGEVLSLLYFCRASLVVSDITGSSKRSAVGQSGHVFTIAWAATVKHKEKSAFHKVLYTYGQRWEHYTE